MKKKLWIPIVIVLLILGFNSSAYSVRMNEYAAVRQMGRIVRIDDTPGLKFRIPFIQTVQTISARTILYDIPESDVITRDKKTMTADNFVLWRVVDPMAYIRTLK